MDFQKRYKFDTKTDLLGKGGFSKVFKANDTLLERTVALKFFTSSGFEKYQVLNEIKKVIKFEHTNLCKYYDVAVINATNIFGEEEIIEVGIMEYLDAGELKKYLKSNPDQVDKLLVDVLKGLSYLHKKGIVHRDLKPQNIIVTMVDDEPVAKITDFGISKLLNAEDNGSSALIGTIEYMAPEQFNPRKYGIAGKITTNLDLWSFGLLVYETIEHKPLFGSRSKGASAEQIMRNILDDSYLAKTQLLPVKYRAIVDRCLIKNASERVQNAFDLIPLFSEEGSSLKISLTDNDGGKIDSHASGGPVSLHDSTLFQTPEAKSVSNPIVESKDKSDYDLHESFELSPDDSMLQTGPMPTEEQETRLYTKSEELKGYDRPQKPGLEKGKDDSTATVGFNKDITGSGEQRSKLIEATSGIRPDEPLPKSNTGSVLAEGNLHGRQNNPDLNVYTDKPASTINFFSEKDFPDSPRKNQNWKYLLYAGILLLLIIGFLIFRGAKRTGAVTTEASHALPLPNLVKITGGRFTIGS